MTFSVPKMLNIEFGNRWDGEEDAKVYKLTASKKENALNITGINEIQHYFFSSDNKLYSLSYSLNGFHLTKVQAKFYNDARPDAQPGYLMGLWDYEVVELFLLNSQTEEYLELEFGPHGHYLAWVEASYVDIFDIL